MRNRGLLIVLLLACALYNVASGQQTALVGTWEEIEGRLDGDGRQTAVRANLLVFTPDGYYMTTDFPPTRPKVNKRLADMTKEELLARFADVRGQRGTYSVSGDRLTTQRLASIDPNEEVATLVRVFKIEGDTVTFTAPDPKIKFQSRFRRVKPNVAANDNR